MFLLLLFLLHLECICFIVRYFVYFCCLEFDDRCPRIYSLIGPCPALDCRRIPICRQNQVCCPTRCGGAGCADLPGGKLVYSVLFMKGLSEVESSRTHFEVLSLGLEGQVLGLLASSPRKLACPRKTFWKTEKLFGKRFFVEIARKIFVKTFFFFGEHLRLCPWSLDLASDFFCVLGLGLES